MAVILYEIKVVLTGLAGCGLHKYLNFTPYAEENT